MSLAAILDGTNKAMRDGLSPAILDSIDRSIQALADSGQAGRATGEGDLVSLPILKDAAGEPIDLAELASERPVVLLVTRGSWCSCCEATLQAYERTLPSIRAAGAVLIATTPETVLDADRPNQADFFLATDKGNRFAHTLGLSYPVPDSLQRHYRDLGIDLARLNGDRTPTLPIPAVFVLASCGRVALAHVDPDFSHRAEPADVIAALRELAGQPFRAAHAA